MIDLKKSAAQIFIEQDKLVCRTCRGNGHTTFRNEFDDYCEDCGGITERVHNATDDDKLNGHDYRRGKAGTGFSNCKDQMEVISEKYDELLAFANKQQEEIAQLKSLLESLPYQR